jgi:hypothetical protein
MPCKKKRSIISKPRYTLHITKLKLFWLFVFLGYVPDENIGNDSKGLFIRLGNLHFANFQES